MRRNAIRSYVFGLTLLISVSFCLASPISWASRDASTPLIPLGRADVSIRDHLDTDSSEETELGNGLDGSEGVEYHMGSMGFYNEPFPQKGLGLSVNSKGTVIGIATVSWWYISLTDWTAFIYSSGNYTEIIPPGWRNVDSCKISSRGTVVGTGYEGEWVHKGFIYRRGTYTEIIPPGW